MVIVVRAVTMAHLPVVVWMRAVNTTTIAHPVRVAPHPTPFDTPRGHSPILT